MRSISNLILTLLVITLGPCLISCQTPVAKKIPKIQNGMLKDQVIELIGSPKSSWRWKGKDRWQYVYPENKDLVTKDIHFENGRVTYKGPPLAPNISATEQDSINSKENLDIETRQESLREQAKENYQKYVNDVKDKDGQERFIPKFQSIQ